MENITRLRMNNKEQMEIILENFSKMLFRRGLIKNQQKTLDTLKSSENKGVIKYKENDTDILIIVSFQKLNGIKKNSEIEDLLLKAKGYKFLIVSDATNKTYVQSKLFKTELFTIYEFLHDITANPLVPQHLILSPSEKEDFLKIYQEKNLAKILEGDVMVRYIGAKKGDIIKIIRETYNTGESIYYRKVV